MCGYVEVNGMGPGKPMTMPLFDEFLPWFEGKVHRFMPAFGGDTRKTIPIIIEEQGRHKLVHATWWYDCTAQVTADGEASLAIGDGTSAKTTFNARNLDSPYWKDALQHSRAVVIATAIGESIHKPGIETPHRYRMESERPFSLGALYQRHPNGLYSAAVITREEHWKMANYHDKAFPGFLPNDEPFIRLWLSKDVEQCAEIDEVLNNPKLYPTLRVERVYSFSSGKTYASDSQGPVTLISDLIDPDSPPQAIQGSLF